MAERGCGGLIQAEAGVDVVCATARPGIVLPAQGHRPPHQLLRTPRFRLVSAW